MQEDFDGSLGRAMQQSAHEERLKKLEADAKAEMERIIPTIPMGDGGMRELRDWFAAHSISSIIPAMNKKGLNGIDYNHAAHWAYEMADAMLEARKK